MAPPSSIPNSLDISRLISVVVDDLLNSFLLLPSLFWVVRERKN
jgi:hypothetical protein